MHFTAVWLAFTAAVAVAAPAPSDGFGDVHLFRRDSILDTRDIELAEVHGVNLTEMYKHSVMERDDGDHFTIWVDRSFTPAEGPNEEPEQVEKRQSARLFGDSGFIRSGSGSLCKNHDMWSITSSSSPFSGGALDIARWGDNNKGEWTWANDGRKRYLVVGGSNGGRNARYVAGSSSLGSGEYGGVGSRDMAHNAWKTYNDFAKQYNGQWRAAAKGTMTCDTIVFGNWFPTVRTFSWELVSTSTRV